MSEPSGMKKSRLGFPRYQHEGQDTEGICLWPGVVVYLIDGRP